MRALANRFWIRLENWLNDSPRDLISWLKLMAQGLAVSLLWGVVVSFIIARAFPEEAAVASLWGWPEEFSYLFIAALSEEAIFRMVPLTIAMIFCRGKKMFWMILTCVVFGFFVFGLAHVPNFKEFMPIGWAVVVALFLQGILGFYWGLLFIKVAKVTDLLPVTAILMTAVIHAAYNFLILKILIALFY